MDANIQFTINSFRQLFPDKIFFPDNSLIFSKIPDISLTAVKFPDISRFSRQVVTLYIGCSVCSPVNQVVLLKLDVITIGVNCRREAISINCKFSLHAWKAHSDECKPPPRLSTHLAVGTIVSTVAPSVIAREN